MRFRRNGSFAHASVKQPATVRLAVELLEARLPPGDLGLTGAFFLDAPLFAEEQTPQAPLRRSGTSDALAAKIRKEQEQLNPFSLAELAGSFGAAALIPAAATAPMPAPQSGQGTDLLPPLVGLDEDEIGGGITSVGANVLTNSRANCGGGRGVIQSETAIAQSGNAIVVGYNDFRAFYCPGTPHQYQVTGWAYSLDNGQTFTDGGPLPGGASLRGDPWLATGPDGTIYLASLWNGLANLAVLRGTVTEEGISWSNPVILPGNFGQFDKEAMAVDPYTGQIYVTYTRFGGPNGLWLYRSDDGGQTFQGAYPIRTGNQPQLQGSFPVIGQNQEVFVAYNIGYPSSSGVGFAVSYDFGETFYDVGQVGTISNFTVPGTDRAPAFPQLAVDISGGPFHFNLYMVWQTQHLSGNGDVVLSKSVDGGFTWSEPIIINDDGTTGLQWHPTISIDGYGNVNVFFYDRRENPGTAITNLYFAQSIDGGESFLPNVKITDTASTFRTSGDGSPTYGDYISSLSTTWDPETYLTSSLVAWADSRDGDPDTYFARVVHDGL